MLLRCVERFRALTLCVCDASSPLLSEVEFDDGGPAEGSRRLGVKVNDAARRCCLVRSELCAVAADEHRRSSLVGVNGTSCDK